MYISFEEGHAEGDALHIQLGSFFIRAPTRFRLLYPVVFLSLPFFHSPRMSRLHRAIGSYMLLSFIPSMPAYCHALPFQLPLCSLSLSLGWERGLSDHQGTQSQKARNHKRTKTQKSVKSQKEKQKTTNTQISKPQKHKITKTQITSFVFSGILIICK